MVGIKERTASDMEGCLILLRAVHEADGYPSAWPADARAWLTPPGLARAWVAHDSDFTRGHVAVAAIKADRAQDLCKATGRQAHGLFEVKRLFVHPRLRSRGVAAALVTSAVRFIREAGAHPILEAADDRPAALRLYERLGWRHIRTTPATWTRANGQRPLLRLYEFDN